MKFPPYIVTGPIFIPYIDYFLTKSMISLEKKKADHAGKLIDRLEQLHNLLKSGAITQDEYNKLKKLIYL